MIIFTKELRDYEEGDLLWYCTPTGGRHPAIFVSYKQLMGPEFTPGHINLRILLPRHGEKTWRISRDVMRFEFEDELGD